MFLVHRLEIYSTENRKREKSSRLLSGLKNRRDKRSLESESTERHLKILGIIRVQMQASYSVLLFLSLQIYFLFSNLYTFQNVIWCIAIVRLYYNFPAHRFYCSCRKFFSLSYDLLVWILEWCSMYYVLLLSGYIIIILQYALFWFWHPLTALHKRARLEDVLCTFSEFGLLGTNRTFRFITRIGCTTGCVYETACVEVQPMIV